MMTHIKRIAFLVIAVPVIFSFPDSVFSSQMSTEPVLDHAWREHEYPSYSFASLQYPPIYQEVDVLHYTIEAAFNLGAAFPSTAYLEASTTINGQAKAETLNELIVDLYDNITINTITLNGTPFTSYIRTQDKIWMDVSADPIQPGEAFDIEISYSHVYGTTYQGLMFRRHCNLPHAQCPTSASPGVCSVDQPYMSPGWWPCFNVPGDKATADIYMTFPDWMTGVANGLLQSEVDNGDGTKTAHWFEQHPLYSDVLAVAMTDYTSWTDTYISPLDATEMTIYYYAFPEDAAKALNDFAVTKDAMVYFAQSYGEYPFINEKYALVETLNSQGSIENQTMTSLSYNATRAAVNWDVIIHELAHQWWGDWVTCATWNHLWLHEGLATYSEILFHEYDSGEPAGPFMAVNYDDGLYDGELADTVYVEDEDLKMPFVPSGAVYEKGGWVFHMLRSVLGDANFFSALKAYGAAHAYSTAVTDDLKTAMETAYGSSLTDFFNQWIYTPYRPLYAFVSKTTPLVGSYKIDVTLRQTQPHQVQDISGTPIRDYYIMPVQFKVHYMDNTSETFTFDNTQRNQSFEILTTKQPKNTLFDEEKRILKEMDSYPPLGNGIQDSTDCEGNFNCSEDQDVDGSDAATFKTDFGRNSFNRPCIATERCNGDFSCDGDVDGTDAALFKVDFGRNSFNKPCPVCVAGDWCGY